MIKFVLGIIIFCGVGGATIVYNWGGHDWDDWRGHDQHHDGGTVAAPEIDPASAMSGLTLLLGGLAAVRGRRAKS